MWGKWGGEKGEGCTVARSLIEIHLNVNED